MKKKHLPLVILFSALFIIPLFSQCDQALCDSDPVIVGLGPDGTYICGDTPPFSVPTATAGTGCGQVNLTFVDTPGGFGCAGPGISRIWTATDDCGNRSTKSQTFVPQDFEAPCLKNVGEDYQLVCGQAPIFSSPSSSDNCGGATITFVDSETPTSFIRSWTSTDACGNTATATQTIFKEDDKSIPAYIFFDRNGNGIQEMDEPNIERGFLNINNGERNVYPDQMGFLNIIICEDSLSNTTDIEFNIDANFSISTQQSYTVMYDALPSELLFGITPIGNDAIIDCSLSSPELICNTSATIYLAISNFGLSSTMADIEFDFDGDFISSTMVPNSSTADQLVWNNFQVESGQTLFIEIELMMPDETQTGVSLEYQLTVTNLTDASQSIENSSSALLCSYDPNDKRADPAGILDEHYTLFEEAPLNYYIRFQNTGNFRAEDIELVDSLDSNLDLNTFEFVNSSHDLTAIELEDDVLKFVFDDIFLPDSTSNEPASHGFVHFKIGLIDQVPEMTVIKNTAYIYFDYNAAIVTNTVFNTMVTEYPDITLASDYLQFEGMVKDDRNILSWLSPNKDITDIFLEHYISDDLNFRTLAHYRGEDLKNKDEFIFSHLDPNIGSNYYRLKMMDVSGDYNYSFIITLNNKDPYRAQVYPIPADQLVYIQSNKSTEIEILNTQGALVLKKTIRQGTNEIDVSQWQTGVYLLKINGTIEKIIVH